MGGAPGGHLRSLRETGRPDGAETDQDVWSNVLWTHESETESPGHQTRGHARRKPDAAVQEETLIPAVRTEVEGSWCGGALLQQDVSSSPSENPP